MHLNYKKHRELIILHNSFYNKPLIIFIHESLIFIFIFYFLVNRFSLFFLYILSSHSNFFPFDKWLCISIKHGGRYLSSVISLHLSKIQKAVRKPWKCFQKLNLKYTVLELIATRTKQIACKCWHVVMLCLNVLLKIIYL